MFGGNEKKRLIEMDTCEHLQRIHLYGGTQEACSRAHIPLTDPQSHVRTCVYSNVSIQEEKQQSQKSHKVEKKMYAIHEYARQQYLFLYGSLGGREREIEKVKKIIYITC